AGGRRVLKAACCLRRSRAANEKRDACYRRDDSNLDRNFRSVKNHRILKLNKLKWDRAIRDTLLILRNHSSCVQGQSLCDLSRITEIPIIPMFDVRCGAG